MNIYTVPKEIAPSIMLFPPTHRIRAVAMAETTSMKGLKIPKITIILLFSSRYSLLTFSNSPFFAFCMLNAWIIFMPAICSERKIFMAESLALILVKVFLAFVRNIMAANAIRGSTAMTVSASFTFKRNITIITPVISNMSLKKFTSTPVYISLMVFVSLHILVTMLPTAVLSKKVKGRSWTCLNNLFLSLMTTFADVACSMNVLKYDNTS